jgi:hypothetical protein
LLLQLLLLLMMMVVVVVVICDHQEHHYSHSPQPAPKDGRQTLPLELSFASKTYWCVWEWVA